MTTDAALLQVLTRRHVQHLASDAAFRRGEEYRAGGRVRSLVVRQDALTATVAGSADYAVSLEVRDGELRHKCSCPVGTGGEFCKHCVAVALVWLNAHEGKAPDESADTAAIVRLDDVRPFLLEQDKATLADWLLGAAENDERLRERLLRQAARTTGKGVDFYAYRRSIDGATSTGGFVHYREAFDFAQRIADAVAPLRGLLDDGHAAEVIDLAEHALIRVSKAILEMDDSDGGMSPILDDLQELHLQACRRARPDPEKLAARLFDWEVDGEWDVFGGAAETYADVLGEKGLALYRTRAEALWQLLPALKPGQREEYSSRRFHLTRIMEALARAGGDLEALVAVKAKDLTLPYHFLQIAELYRKAGRSQAALDWAERGVKAFPNNLDSRLVEFLADEYHARQRHDEALALIWRLFEWRPGLDYFQLVKHHADRAQAWPPWRERALAVLHTAATNAARPRRGMAPGYRLPDHSELVQVFLWEKETEQAWQEAQSGGCSSPLWLELAASREARQPADAANVYLRESEKLVAQKNNGAYAEAVRLLTKARALLLGLGRGEAWQTAIGRLRLTHKAKRNFIALAAKL